MASTRSMASSGDTSLLTEVEPSSSTVLLSAIDAPPVRASVVGPAWQPVTAGTRINRSIGKISQAAVHKAHALGFYSDSLCDPVVLGAKALGPFRRRFSSAAGFALTLSRSPEQYFRLGRPVPIPVEVCPHMLTATLRLLRALTVSGFLAVRPCSL